MGGYRMTPSLEQRLATLLAAIAEVHRPCRYCDTPLYFVRHRNSELVAYTAAGENHLFDCPYTQRLRRRREEQQTLLDTNPIPD